MITERRNELKTLFRELPFKMQTWREGSSPSRENSVLSQDHQTKVSDFQEMSGAAKEAKRLEEQGDTTNETCDNPTGECRGADVTPRVLQHCPRVEATVSTFTISFYKRLTRKRLDGTEAVWGIWVEPTNLVISECSTFIPLLEKEIHRKP